MPEASVQAMGWGATEASQPTHWLPRKANTANSALQRVAVTRRTTCHVTDTSPRHRAGLGSLHAHGARWADVSSPWCPNARYDSPAGGCPLGSEPVGQAGCFAGRAPQELVLRCQELRRPAQCSGRPAAGVCTLAAGGAGGRAAGSGRRGAEL